MLTEKTILEKTGHLEPKERAAALAHYIYMLTYTIDTGMWEVRVPIEWADLDEAARAFNLASAEVWARSKEVLKAWIEAVNAIESE